MYEMQTFEECVIHEYTGIGFREIENLLLTEYLLYLRDGVIYRLSQTEAGKDYLEQAFILEQTEPDREKLRSRYERG